MPSITAVKLCLIMAMFFSSSIIQCSGNSCSADGLEEEGTDDDCHVTKRHRPPHIVFILADDVGWNDVGFHNSFVQTPNMDRLVKEGLEFTQYYTTPLCTPSRASFMTGKYPSNNGLHHYVLLPLSSACLPLGQPMISEQLKEAGYTTKMVGKWHLGCCNASCLPTRRGFDEYHGSTGALADYFNWTYRADIVENFHNESISLEGLGTHLMMHHTAIAKRMILDHKGKQNPLFLYVAPFAAHDPYNVTDDMLNRHPSLALDIPEESDRRKFLGLVASLDDMVGNVTQALKDAHMYDNSIIVFASDNGGATVPFLGLSNFAGNNYPLRGTKGSMFEGAIRVPAFVHSPLLAATARGRKTDGLLHVTDWFPTFLSLAGGQKQNNLDGIDQRKFILGESSYSRRKEFLIYLTDFNIDGKCSDVDTAYRFGDWKLIQSKHIAMEIVTPETADLWTKAAESSLSPTLTGDTCKRVSPDGSSFFGCLFNLTNDPSEQHDLYDEYPDVVELLKAKINHYRQRRVDAISRPREMKFLHERTTLVNGVRVLQPGFCDPVLDSALRPFNKELCPLS